MKRNRSVFYDADANANADANNARPLRSPPIMSSRMYHQHRSNNAANDTRFSHIHVHNHNHDHNPVPVHNHAIVSTPSPQFISPVQGNQSNAAANNAALEFTSSSSSAGTSNHKDASAAAAATAVTEQYYHNYGRAQQQRRRASPSLQSISSLSSSEHSSTTGLMLYAKNANTSTSANAATNVNAATITGTRTGNINVTITPSTAREQMYRNSHPFVSVETHSKRGYVDMNINANSNINTATTTTSNTSNTSTSSAPPRVPVLLDSDTFKAKYKYNSNPPKSVIAPSFTRHEKNSNSKSTSNALSDLLLGMSSSSWDSSSSSNTNANANANANANDNDNAANDYSNHDHDTLSVASGLFSLKMNSKSVNIDHYRAHSHQDASNSNTSNISNTSNCDNNLGKQHTHEITSETSTREKLHQHQGPSIVKKKNADSSFSRPHTQNIAATPRRKSSHSHVTMDTCTRRDITTPANVNVDVGHGHTSTSTSNTSTPGSVPLKKRRVVGYGDDHVPSFMKMEQFRSPIRSHSGSTSSSTAVSAKESIATPPIRPRTLALPSDNENVNSLHKFVRSSLLEVFQVNTIKIATKQSKSKSNQQSNSNSNLFPGRVGLCCVYCKNIPKNKQFTHARIFPKNVQGMYRAVCGFQRIHFKNCASVPQNVKNHYEFLKSSDKTRGKTKYWETSCELLGLVNVNANANANDVSVLREEGNGNGKVGIVFSSSLSSV